MLRYSLYFTAVLIPLIFLGPFGLVAAAALTSRRFARREGRPFELGELRRLTLLSIIWPAVIMGAISSVLFGSIAVMSLGLLPVALVMEAGIVFLGYRFVGAWVIERELGRKKTAGPPVAGGAPRTVVRGTGSEVAARLLERKRSRNRDSSAIGLATIVLWPFVGVTVLFVAIVAIGLVQAIFGQTSSGPPSSTIIVAVGLLAMGMWLGVTAVVGGRYPTDRMVLWLRRFHRDQGFPFNVFLEDACRGVALPVTLQDSRVSSSTTAANARAAAVLPTLLMLAGLALMTNFLSGFPGEDDVASRVGLALAAAGGGLHLFRGRLFGAVRLQTARGRKRARDLLRRIQDGKSVPQALTVLSCPDDGWQAWVLALLAHADVVVLDVTELSGSLHWELEQVAREKRPEQLILACGIDRGNAPDPWSERRDEIAQLMGAGQERCQRFVYELGQWGVLRGDWRRSWLARRRHKAIMKAYEEPLVDAMARALEAAEERGDLAPGAETA
jgi:hypothetical protein